MRRVLLLLTSWWLFTAGCWSFAQEVRATISGTISDPSGAPIPGARVTVTSVARNTSVTTDTNESGSFVTPFLEPGTYSLAAEHAGFKRSQQQNIELQTLDRVRVTSNSRSVRSPKA